jgi:hypothetical protein
MTGALSIHFTAIVWRYESKGGWYFVSLPDEDSARIREMFKSQEQGWGRLNVEASFLLTERLREDKRDFASYASHKTAIWFDTKRNTYLLPIKAEIRNGEGIDEGDEVDVTVRI